MASRSGMQRGAVNQAAATRNRTSHMHALAQKLTTIPLLFAAISLAAQAVTPEQFLVRVSMRDGVKLSTRISKPPGKGKFPALLIRTPYGKGPELPKGYYTFIDHGYVMVMQDVRGRYDSEGVFRTMEQEGPDANDTINWIARQWWSNGNVGMIGGSYLGMVQWKAALTGNPHLKAIFPVVSGIDEYEDRYYSRGGAFKVGHRLLWMSENFKTVGFTPPPFADYTRHVPLRTSDRFAVGRRIESYQSALNHPAYDAYWRAISTREKIDRIHVPVFSVGGWYDNYVQGDLEAFALLQRRSSVNHLLIGPWPHDMSQRFAGADFGRDSGAPIRRHQLDWFDYWLKSPQPAPEFPYPPLRIFVMGINRWRDEHEWPLARARYTPYYLGGRGNARSIRGDGTLQQDPAAVSVKDEYLYDPRKPVPTLGGAVCCTPKIFPWGPLDQRPAESRDDVLVYTTPALKADTEITGPIRASLWISTSATDTDFTAKLVDVYPDGYARNLCDGIVRLRYRNSLQQPSLAVPGEIYPITIDAGVTSNVFKAGHRIRLEISSSNFPRFDRNPNTGRVIADETELRPARNAVFHGRQHPSFLLLPVIP